MLLHLLSKTTGAWSVLMRMCWIYPYFCLNCASISCVWNVLQTFVVHFDLQSIQAVGFIYVSLACLQLVILEWQKDWILRSQWQYPWLEHHCIVRAPASGAMFSHFVSSIHVPCIQNSSSCSCISFAAHGFAIAIWCFIIASRYTPPSLLSLVFCFTVATLKSVFSWAVSMGVQIADCLFVTRNLPYWMTSISSIWIVHWRFPGFWRVPWRVRVQEWRCRVFNMLLCDAVKDMSLGV